MASKLSASSFYAEYYGHKPTHLKAVRELLVGAGAKRFIYLAGDSSLDNKHWFFPGGDDKAAYLNKESDFVGAALNGYESALQPALMVKDVAYWINKECAEARWKNTSVPHTCCINTAVEESCLVQRETSGLLEHDIFIRDNIGKDDVLVVDVGGNDIALRPTLGVIFNMATLLYLTPTAAIRADLAPGLLYFIHMFRTRLRHYVEKLVAKQKPRKVILCMLYFLDETGRGSWCDAVLERLGYNENPEKLQTVMRRVYAWGVSQVSVPGVEVVPLPLYEYLDGKTSADYVQRVEPSVQGGEKIARAIASKVFAGET